MDKESWSKASIWFLVDDEGGIRFEFGTVEEAKEGRDRWMVMLSDSQTSIEEHLVCCDSMKSALIDPTDNESYSSVARFNEEGRVEIGNELPPIVVCPWCRTPALLLQRPPDPNVVLEEGSEEEES